MSDLKGRKLGLTNTVDASEMRFNPLIVDHASGIMSHYPDLNNIVGVRNYFKSKSRDDITFRNRAIKYMVWLYSSDTILNVKPVEPLIDRKYKAADLAGFKLDKENNFPDNVIEKLFNLKDELFVLAVLDYLKEWHDELYAEIIVCEEQHYEAMRLRITPTSGSTKASMEVADLKKKLRLECKELMIDIKSYWDQFWEDHLDMKAVGQGLLYKSIEDRAKINTGV